MYEIYNEARSYLWLVLHRRWIVLACIIAICTVGWAGVAVWPNTYQVSAKIYLDTHSVLKGLLKGLAVENTVRAEFAQVMRRTLLTRPNIEAVMREVDLDYEAMTPEETERQVRTLAEAVTVSSVDVRSNNIYEITYSNQDPHVAQRVVESLLNLFVDKVLSVSRVDTEVAQRFLDEQIKSYRVRLEASEERLKDFKLKNRNLMPAESGGYMRQLEQLKSRAADAQLELDETERRSTELRKQVAAAKARIRSAPAASGQVLPAVQGIDARISVLENNISIMLMRYTDQHPDVTRSQRALQGLMEEREANPPQAGGEVESVVYDGTDSAGLYQELKVILGETVAEIAALKVRVSEYNSRTEGTERLVEQFPQIEAELTRLDRDYAINKNTYEELVQRRETARISRRAEQSVDSVQFHIIEPPIVPIIPVSPNRPLLFSLVLVAAIAGGIGLAIVMEQMRQTFYTPGTLKDKVRLPVLGSVSMVWTEQEKTARRKGVVAFAGIAGLLIAVYAGLMLVDISDLSLVAQLKSVARQFL